MKPMTQAPFIRPLVAGACLLLGPPAIAVETAPNPVADAEVQIEPARETVVHPLQESLAQTLDLLEANGLAFDEGTARRSVIKALAQSADPGARLMTDEEHRQLAETSIGMAYDSGIGFVWSNRSAVITGVAESSAAAEAGIQPGDRLLGIGEEPAGRLDVAGIQARLRGMEAGEVEVVIRRDEAEPEEHTLELRRVTLDPIEESVRLPANLGYIRVNGLFPGAGIQIADIVASWSIAGIDGVVLDLRGANGGDLDSVITVASLMSEPESPLFSYRDAAGQEVEVHRARAGARLGAPLMLLVDEHTSGASEALAAVLSGTGRGAMLIGTPTLGDPLIREPVALADGYVLYIASRTLVVADGESYGGKETVRPDIRVNPRAIYPDFDPAAPLLTDPRGVTDQELETRDLRVYINGDIPLTRAVDVLMGLKALNLHSFDYEAPGHP